MVVMGNEYMVFFTELHVVSLGLGEKHGYNY